MPCLDAVSPEAFAQASKPTNEPAFKNSAGDRCASVSVPALTHDVPLMNSLLPLSLLPAAHLRGRYITESGRAEEMLRTQLNQNSKEGEDLLSVASIATIANCQAEAGQISYHRRTKRLVGEEVHFLYVLDHLGRSPMLSYLKYRRLTEISQQIRSRRLQHTCTIPD
jgi:hypothetical protein